MAFVSPIPVQWSSHTSFSAPKAIVPRHHVLRHCRRRISMEAQQSSPASPFQPVQSQKLGPKTSTAPKSQPPSHPPFAWLDNWYPVAWAKDVPHSKPIAVTIWNRHYVLFRDTVTGNYVVMDDVCPHRAAPLSEGRLYERSRPDGSKETILECGYHGWRFDCTGRCVDIPVADLQKRIPAAADVGGLYATHVSIAGLIFVWLGDRAKADVSKIPVPKDLLDLGDRVTTYRNSYRVFPFNFATLLENVADPAHVQWSHHGTSQGNRNTVSRNGILEILEKDFDCGFFRAGIRIGDSPSHRLGVSYEAPTCVAYRVQSPVSTAAPFSLLTYVVPIDYNRSALFAVNCTVDMPRISKLVKRITPRWYEHTISNLILDGDSLLLQWQEAHMQNCIRDGYGSAWKKEYTLASGTWDSLVVEVRRWLDHNCHSIPYRKQLSSEAPTVRQSRREINDRYAYHTRHCESCRPALQNLRTGRVAACVGAGIGFATFLCSALLFAALGSTGMTFFPLPLQLAAMAGIVGCAAFLAVATVLGHFIKLLTYTEISYDVAHAE